MRSIRYSVAMSLDGYIAGPNGETDWITLDPEIDFGALINRFDTVLMGRRTFEIAQASGGLRMMAGMSAVVVSRTLSQDRFRDVTIIGDDLAASLIALRDQTGKDIWLFGGGSLFRSLLDARLVDAIDVSVIPVLLGGGTPFLPPATKRTPLKLINTRVYKKTGTLALEYTV